MLKPELFRAAARFVSIKEYVTFPLIGEWSIDYSMASSISASISTLDAAAAVANSARVLGSFPRASGRDE